MFNKYNQHHSRMPRQNNDSQAFKNISNAIKDKKLSEIDLKEMIKFNGLVHKFATICDIKANQIRKIFNEIRKIERKLNPNNPTIDKIKDDLTMLYPKISYAQNRKTNGKQLLHPEFAKFLYQILDKVLKNNSKDEFDRFVKIMEAFVGFSKKDK